jgi:hypothetical protein
VSPVAENSVPDTLGWTPVAEHHDLLGWRWVLGGCPVKLAAWLPLALTSACGGRIENAAGPDAGTEAASVVAPPTSTPVTLASGQNTPQGIAVNDSVVAWGNYASGHGDGSVVVVGLDGGSPITIASSGEPGAIALDSTSVYWQDWANDLVMKAPLDGGAPTTLATAAGPVAVSGSNIYWIQDVSLVGMPTAGGVTTTLASVTSSAPVLAMFANGSRVCWIGDDVQDVPIGGGTITTVAQDVYWGRNLVTDLAVDATSAYWLYVGNAGTAVMKAPLTGGTEVTMATRMPSNQPASIAVDARNAYWTESGIGPSASGTILSVPVGGGTPTTLAIQQPGPNGIAVDATSVYWANAGFGYDQAGGTIVKIQKQ